MKPNHQVKRTRPTAALRALWVPPRFARRRPLSGDVEQSRLRGWTMAARLSGFLVLLAFTLPSCLGDLYVSFPSEQIPLPLRARVNWGFRSVIADRDGRDIVANVPANCGPPIGCGAHFDRGLERAAALTDPGSPAHEAAVGAVESSRARGNDARRLEPVRVPRLSCESSALPRREKTDRRRTATLL